MGLPQPQQNYHKQDNAYPNPDPHWTDPATPGDAEHGEVRQCRGIGEKHHAENDDGNHCS